MPATLIAKAILFNAVIQTIYLPSLYNNQE